MKIKAEVVNKTRKYKINKKEVKYTVEHIVQKFSNAQNINIDIAFVGKNRIRKLNKDFRKIDKVTNVLSFIIDDIPSKELTGEIVICPEKVEEEAKKLGNNFPDYALFIMIHGVLHILGFDHEKEEERLRMEKLEESLFSEVKTIIKKEVIERCPLMP